MNFLKVLLAKYRLSRLQAFLAVLIFLGMVLRFVYIWDVGHQAYLNLPLPKSDLFTHDLLARNLLAPQPLEIKTPAYPLTVGYLGMIYRLFGVADFPFYAANFLLSMISVVMLAAIGRNIFGLTSGLLAGLALVFYRMDFFYDGLKDGTALSQFLLIAAVFAFVRLQQKRNLLSYCAFLLFALLSCLIRVFYWFMAVPAIVYCLIKFRQWRRPVFVIVNILFALAAVWSFANFRSADGFQHKFGVHFYIGNRAGALGLLEKVPGISLNADGFARETILQAYAETGRAKQLNRYWIQKTFDSYRQSGHSWFEVVARKMVYLTNNFEPHNLSSIYFYEKYTGLKYFPRLDFAVIFALALAGMVMVLLRRHRAGAALFLPTAFLAVMILSVFICSRYRMPLVPFLCLYAGFGLRELIAVIRGKEFLRSGMLIMVVLTGLLWANQPVRFFNQERDIRFWEDEARRAERYYTQAADLRRQYENWENLSYSKKIALTIALEKQSMPQEFVAAYAKVLPLTEGSRVARNMLLRQRAQLEESSFNFKKALAIWEELAADSYWRPEARRKIAEIKIIGPLLDKDF